MKVLIATALSLSMALPAHALWGRRQPRAQTVNQNPAAALNVLNAPQSAEQAQAANAVLQTLAAEMTDTLSNIETLIAQGSSSQALSLAKRTLDTVRVKTGIDPKAKLQESFYAATVFPEGARDMQVLPAATKQIVIETVRDFRGGLYLDIMNLSKRTSLLYIKALHAQIKKEGGVTSEDRNKIIKDLASASIVPIYVVDKNGTKIVAFDEDVANEDHTYMFNREIKMYLLNAKELQMTEAAFDKFKGEYKTYLGSSQTSAPTQTSGRATQQCIAEMNILVTGRSGNVGTSVLDYSIESCSKNNNFVGKFQCMEEYSINVTGRPGNAGMPVTSLAIEYCK